MFVRHGANGEPSAYRCAREEESRIHCPLWLQVKLIHCRHLVNLQHWVTFSSHAQRSCLRLRLIESVWNHVAVRHSEKPSSSESKIGYRFLFLTVYRIAIPAFFWEVVMSKEMGVTQGSLYSDVVFNCHRGNGWLTRLVHLSMCTFIVVCCISWNTVKIDRRL